MSENMDQNEQGQPAAQIMPGLPPELLEVCGENTRRLSGFDAAIRHIGHTLVDIDLPLTASAVQTCGDVKPSSALHTLKRLEELGLLETYVPVTPPTRPISGRWLTARMRFFRPTEFGSSLLPKSNPEECALRNPFARLAPIERRVAECASCHLKLLGSFTTSQVTECAKFQEGGNRTTNKVTAILRDFCLAGVLARAKDPSIQPLFGAQHPIPFSYSLTDKGARYLTPAVDENCPSPERITSSQEVTLLSAFKPAPHQQEVLDIIVEMYGALITGSSKEPIRRATILNMGKSPSTVDVILTKLVAAGYLEKRALPGRTLTDHFAPTEAGARLLGDMYYDPEAATRRSIAKKRQTILQLCAPHVTDRVDLAILAGLEKLPTMVTLLLYERLQQIHKQRAISPDDIWPLIDFCKKLL